MNPLKEYLVEKRAFFNMSPATKQMLTDTAKSTAVQYAVSTALVAAPVVASKVYGAVTKKRDFNRMMDQNPDLHVARAENPTQFNNFYNSMHRQNPQFASDPIVAGAYMNKMMANPATAGFAIVDSMSKTPSYGAFNDAYRTGAQAGVKAFSKGYDSMMSHDHRAEELRKLELEDKFKRLTAPINPLESDVKRLELESKNRKLLNELDEWKRRQEQQELWGRRG